MDVFMKVFFFLCNQQTQLKSRLLFAMTGSLEAKRPHADFSTEMWVWYQEGSHLYKQRWSFCFQFRKVPKQFFFSFGNLDENVTLECSVSWSLSLNISNRARFYFFYDIQRQQRSENSAPDGLNDHLQLIGSGFCRSHLHGGWNGFEVH